MTSPSSMAPGTTVANRFRLERLLGRGGMGSVWAAWHITLNIEVAIKFIDPQYVSSRDAWSRFSHEAMAAAKIRSPHVVSVLDFGTDEYQRPYLAMELLEGEELASLLEREPTLPVPMVVSILTQACKGLARAHREGVVHRDIKPDNLFLCHEEDEEGFLLKILDFGIAKINDQNGLAMAAHRTGTGQVLGTPLYMSPEQAYGNRPVDHRSDLYSLAVVAYRSLTGRVPFHSDGVGELIVAITTHAATPPSHLRAGLPAGIDAWFARALAKEPEHRFRSAREMATSFATACGMAPVADSTAQFSALTAADLAELTGPLSQPPRSSAPVSQYPSESSAVVPLVRRGNASPSSHPPSRRQAVTLQGTATSYSDPGIAPPVRRRLLVAGLASAALVVLGLLGWQWQASHSGTSAVASSPVSSATVVLPVESLPVATATTTASAPTVAPASASSAPVISISSLPADTARPGETGRGPGGVQGKPVGKAATTAATSASPWPGAITAPTTTSTSPPAPATAAPVHNDYGL